MASLGAKNGAYRHGMTGCSLLNRWKAMRQRCNNPDDAGFRNYGGRGITICQEWQEFSAFSRWAAATGYQDSLQLDRTDNDGPYSPENCRWVTPADNCRNRRTNRRYSFFGEEMVVLDAARKFGLSVRALQRKLDKGMSPEQAVALESTDHNYFGESMSFAEAERRFGIKWHTIRWRIKSGMCPDEAATRPVRRQAA